MGPYHRTYQIRPPPFLFVITVAAMALSLPYTTPLVFGAGTEEEEQQPLFPSLHCGSGRIQKEPKNNNDGEKGNERGQEEVDIDSLLGGNAFAFCQHRRHDSKEAETKDDLSELHVEDPHFFADFLRSEAADAQHPPAAADHDHDHANNFMFNNHYGSAPTQGERQWHWPPMGNNVWASAGSSAAAEGEEPGNAGGGHRLMSPLPSETNSSPNGPNLLFDYPGPSPMMKNVRLLNRLAYDHHLPDTVTTGADDGRSNLPHSEKSMDGGSGRHKRRRMGKTTASSSSGQSPRILRERRKGNWDRGKEPRMDDATFDRFLLLIPLYWSRNTHKWATIAEALNKERRPSENGGEFTGKMLRIMARSAVSYLQQRSVPSANSRYGRLLHVLTPLGFVSPELCRKLSAGWMLASSDGE